VDSSVAHGLTQSIDSINSAAAAKASIVKAQRPDASSGDLTGANRRPSRGGGAFVLAQEFLLGQVPPIWQEIPIPWENPAEAPEGFEWRGNGPPGSGQGNYIKPGTPEKIHPDMEHAPPKGPHWGYRDPQGRSWDVYPDGRVLPGNMRQLPFTWTGGPIASN